MEKEYDLILIVASIVVAFLTSFLSIAFASSIVWSQRYHMPLWNLGAAVILGLGIWTMHFIGMLALHLGVIIKFDYLLTAFSAAVAVVSAYGAFRLLLKPNAGQYSQMLAAVTLGTGVLIMHYMGMDAMKMSPPIEYDYFWVSISVLIAYMASYVGLEIFIRSSQREKHNIFVWYNLLSAVVIGLAVSLMHYVGMRAASFPVGSYCTVEDGVEVGPLAIYVVSVVAFILITAFLFLVYEQGKEVRAYLRDLEVVNSSLEQKVHDRTIEISQALDRLQSAQKQLIESEKLASLGGLVAGVAHEINTPLGIAVTSSSLLSEHVQGLRQHYQDKTLTQSAFERFFEQTKEAFDILNDSLHRSANLVTSFKQLATDQSSDQIYTFNVYESVANIAKSLTHVTKTKKVVVNIDCDEKLSICSNPGALSQVMTNLIMNACIHAFDQADEQNRIDVNVVDGAGVLHVTVTDNGKGMTEEVLSKVFEPFFTTRRGSGGSGLGMCLVYNMVTQKLKGNIAVTSELGKGSQFSFTIAKDIG